MRDLLRVPRWDEHWNALCIGVLDDRAVLIMQFAFTFAIITAPLNDPWFYEDRWCYATMEGALEGAVNWLRGEDTEPTGWHRHPATGRRRENGDPATEYINH